jgi:hypothetical protein
MSDDLLTQRPDESCADYTARFNAGVPHVDRSQPKPQYAVVCSESSGSQSLQGIAQPPWYDALVPWVLGALVVAVIVVIAYRVTKGRRRP